MIYIEDYSIDCTSDRNDASVESLQIGATNELRWNEDSR